MSDWGEFPWAEIDNFNDILAEQVSILDVLELYDIEYAKIYSGGYSYKLRCPFDFHAGGNERTPSFYVSADQKTFNCFGCSSYGTSVDFIKYYRGISFIQAMEYLYKTTRIDLNVELPEKKQKDPDHSVFKHTFETGEYLREFIKKQQGQVNYKTWCNRANKVYIKLDEFLDKGDDVWADAKQYKEKLIKFLENK